MPRKPPPPRMCKNCKKLFTPKPYGEKARFCYEPECQEERKRETQKRYKGRGVFCKHCKGPKTNNQALYCNKPACQAAKKIRDLKLRKKYNDNRKPKNRYITRAMVTESSGRKGLCKKCGLRPIAKGNWFFCKTCQSKNNEVPVGMGNEYSDWDIDDLDMEVAA